MSNEVKRWWIDLRPHSNARAQGYSTRHSAWSRPIVRFGVNAVCVMPVKDHERIVAEKDAEIERLKRERAKYEADCKRIEYFDDLHEKVATQARVIEKLKERLTSWISETHPNDEHLRNMCLMVEERELAAIEKGEA